MTYIEQNDALDAITAQADDETLIKMLADLDSDPRDEAMTVTASVLRVLESRLPEAEFIALCEAA
tara:strand:- start:166 stop:360 length:195 start_codon:yes stop_codon:yes gene_type:complete